MTDTPKDFEDSPSGVPSDDAEFDSAERSEEVAAAVDAAVDTAVDVALESLDEDSREGFTESDAAAEPSADLEAEDSSDEEDPSASAESSTLEDPSDADELPSFRLPEPLPLADDDPVFGTQRWEDYQASRLNRLHLRRQLIWAVIILALLGGLAALGYAGYLPL